VHISRLSGGEELLRTKRKLCDDSNHQDVGIYPESEGGPEEGLAIEKVKRETRLKKGEESVTRKNRQATPPKKYG